MLKTISSLTTANNVSGLGTMAYQNANLVAITGGTINVTTVNQIASVSSNASYTSATMQLTPVGYINFDLNGTLVKIPYYSV